MIDLSTLDTMTPEHFHARGSLKWSTHPDALPGWVAEMDFGCAPPIVQALHEAVDSLNFGYLPPSVAGAMSAAASAWLERTYDWRVDASMVRPLPDVLTAYKLVIQHFIGDDAAVIVPTPSYAPFLSIPASLGRRVIELPLERVEGRWVVDPATLDRAFSDGGGLLVWCDPHNPTGTVYTADEMAAVAEVVDRHGGRVFADAIHAPIVYPGARHVPYASINATTASHTISSYSATKGWNLAGLKAAQVVFANEADLERWQGVSGYAEVGASTFGLIANTAAYSAGGRWLASVVDYLDSTRKSVAFRLASELPDASVFAPESTYFAWLDLRFAGLGENTVPYLRERAGVELTDGQFAGAGFTGFARLNFATARPIVDEMIDRLVAELA